MIANPFRHRYWEAYTLKNADDEKRILNKALAIHIEQSVNPKLKSRHKIIISLSLLAFLIGVLFILNAIYATTV